MRFVNYNYNVQLQTVNSKYAHCTYTTGTAFFFENAKPFAVMKKKNAHIVQFTPLYRRQMVITGLCHPHTIFPSVIITDEQLVVLCFIYYHSISSNVKCWIFYVLFCILFGL